jgi:membrane protein implicated in regulation of membrane protease activity
VTLRLAEDFSQTLSGLDLPPAPWLLVIGVLAALLLAALAGWRRAATRASRASRARQRRARRAETEAERFLESLGYAILERQVTRVWRLEVDGELREVASRADLLVERGRRLFVADVKSGEIAPRPHQPATRRQLLEYLLAFGADGALVVDMAGRRVHAVSFPDLLERV